ncbi:MAG: SDR family oxidoreductase [Chloroflexi bacterium]|nr:SDR family oxidoreductase [Chloroflexota bacterium]
MVIISGASAGIGRATAVALAQSGANVVLVARRQERLEVLAQELATYPGRRLAVSGDIGEPAFAQAIVQQTMHTFGKIDVLVNNAGVGQQSQLVQMPLDDMRRLLDTNVLGLLYLTQTAVTQMKTKNQGHIINISSIVSQRPLPKMGLYCASKTAVNFLSRTLRMELRPYNIRVSTVYPGRTQTEFGEALLGTSGANPTRLARVPADRVAKAVVKTIRSGRQEVYITWYDWLFVHFNRLFPHTSDWLTNQLAKRYP